MDRRGPEPGTQLYDYLASPWLPAVTLKQPWVSALAQGADE
jgi:hypothetical protein